MTPPVPPESPRLPLWGNVVKAAMRGDIPHGSDESLSLTDSDAESSAGATAEAATEGEDAANSLFITAVHGHAAAIAMLLVAGRSSGLCHAC